MDDQLVSYTRHANDPGHYYLLGCRLLNKNLFCQALNNFDGAIAKNSNCADYYFSRSVCYAKLQKYKESLVDATKCLALNANHREAREQQIRCQIILGNFKDAKKCTYNAMLCDPNNVVLKRQARVIEKCYSLLQSFEKERKLNNYEQALRVMVNVRSFASFSSKYKIITADLLLKTKRYTEALRGACELIDADDKNDAAYFIRGQSYFYLKFYNSAISDLEHSLRLSPKYRIEIKWFLKQSKRCLLKIRASDAVSKEDYITALRLYTEALDVDVENLLENAKLYFNSSIVFGKMGNLNESIKKCSKAIQLDPNYFKAYLRRAHLWRRALKFRESVLDFDAAISLVYDNEYVQLREATLKEWKQYAQSCSDRELI